jgi:spore maturation protein CgeB
MNIVVIGLSITSSWGNGHATTYRGLLRSLAERGHSVTFLEWDAPWYAANRDMPDPSFCRTVLYKDITELFSSYYVEIQKADACIVGSYVRDAIDVGNWVTSTCSGVTAFYDIDTPVTIAALESGSCEYLVSDLIPKYDIYLSFTGGSILRKIERIYGSPAARELYCSFDPEIYFPVDLPLKWDLGYLGTYSDDRQPTVDELVIEPSRRSPKLRAVIAGPKYPAELNLPTNVERIDHVPPSEHRAFYNSQKFAVNVTRADMIAAGYSPSVRLFEAAACGVPIISDYWNGLESFFEFDREILIAETADDVLTIMDDISDERRAEIGRRARTRVLQEHTADHRAMELERHIGEAAARSGKSISGRVYKEGVLTAQGSY